MSVESTIQSTSMLVIQQISKDYSSRVLSDVHLEIRAGEIHALLGANGAVRAHFARLSRGWYKQLQGPCN